MTREELRNREADWPNRMESDMGDVAEARQSSSVVQNAPARMLEMAIEKGAGLEQMQQLMDLHERWEENQARKAYVQAMTAFKSDPPTVRKSRTVSYSGTHYTHASLADVCDAAISGMSKHGLSHRWETRQEGGSITVICVITHEAGHSESTQLSAGADNSGKKNPIQQIASTVTYLERYTLMAALGLASKEMDDDGHGSAPPPPIEYVSEKLAANIREMVGALPDDRKANFWQVLRDNGGVTKIDDLSQEAAEKLAKRLHKTLKELGL